MSNASLISIQTRLELEQIKDAWKNDVMALVPTMGNLHAGHKALVEKAKTVADKVMLYIYVNPLQFGPKEDFADYPRTQSQDLKLCEEWGVDAVFYPSDALIYPHGKERATQVVPPAHLNNIQYGLLRPWFFTGVTTVLATMFNLIRPKIAVFGQKDAQQCCIVKQMVRDLNLDVSIIGVPTVREADGLALSSRNVYLNPEQRNEALCLSQLLKHVHAQFHAGETNSNKLLSQAEETYKKLKINFPTLVLEFIDIVDMDTFESPSDVTLQHSIVAAAKLGNIFIIDCLGLNESLSFQTHPLFESQFEKGKTHAATC